MKKLALLLLLFPFTMLGATWYEGAITLNNGAIRSGFIEIPEANHNKIKFRTSKKAETEKIVIEDVKGFWIINEENLRLEYVTLRIADMQAFSKDFKVEDKKSWLGIEKSGTVNILTAYYSGTAGSGFVYYLHKPWEDRCYYLAAFYGGITVSVGVFKALKETVSRIFKNDCPELAMAMTKEAYKEKGLFLIQDLHTEICGNK